MGLFTVIHDRTRCHDGARYNAAVVQVARTELLGVAVDHLTVADLHTRILTFVRGHHRATILHANVHAINLAQHDEAFAGALRSADLVLCDGFGVILGARILGHHIPERITYAEWTWQLAEFCQREALSLYLLGGRPGVAQVAAGKLCERFPALRIAGTHHGYFDKQLGSSENADVISAVNAVRPDLLLIGFGMPIQEAWVTRNRTALDAGVVLTAGAALDYVSGALRRPPRWMTTRGLEWLGRLAIEPRRLARRYVVGNPRFVWRVLRERLRRT